MKDLLKRLGISIAVNSAFVAVDQAVRTVVSHTIKSRLEKKQESKK